MLQINFRVPYCPSNYFKQIQHNWSFTRNDHSNFSNYERKGEHFVFPLIVLESFLIIFRLYLKKKAIISRVFTKKCQQEALRERRHLRVCDI